MALIVCPHCGTQVSDKAKKCPQCGNNPHKKPRRKWGKKDYIILSCIIAAVIAVGVALFFILRPDPYLKKGRDYLSNDIIQKYKDNILSKTDRYIDISDFDIRDYIKEEWDRKSSIEHFNIPLKNDAVYSVCAYSFYRETNDDVVMIDNGVPTLPCFITHLLKIETLFVVFRNDEPSFIRDRKGLEDDMKSEICVVKKDGSVISFDFHDNLEFYHIESSNKKANGKENLQEVMAEMAAYLNDKYGDYDIVCGCNSVNEIRQQHKANMEEDSISETDSENGTIIDGFEYNAQLLDYDGDFTNIRNAPSGTVVDKLYGYKGANEYYMYLTDKNGEWWRIRDNKVYDKSSGEVRYLEGNQAWIHSSCIKKTRNQGLDANLYGRIGGDNSAWMKISDGQGSYHFLDYTRDVQVKEYNRSLGKLIVHGYATGSGKYIGEFDGTFDGTSYSGTFTNYKGVKITFDLSVK